MACEKKMNNNALKIVYIAGNGHSGSTLLDILVSSHEACFSGGELNNITRDTILEEYCACGTLISQCDVWTQVFKQWKSKMGMSLDEYKKLRMKFERNKVTLRTFKNKLFPSDEFIQYCLATKELYLTIQHITGKNIIVDSSKAPQRIAVLQRIADIHVLHICRNFSGILNSGKKFISKNIEAGVEIDFVPRRTWRILLDWIVTNILTVLFCLGGRKSKINYNVLVSNPDVLFRNNIFFGIEYHDLLEKEFVPEHMLAGNMIRMNKSIKIDPTVGRKLQNLTPQQMILGRIVDGLFWFWS